MDDGVAKQRTGLKDEKWERNGVGMDRWVGGLGEVSLHSRLKVEWREKETMDETYIKESQQAMRPFWCIYKIKNKNNKEISWYKSYLPLSLQGL